MTEWVQVCAADDIEEEDVIRFDHGDRTFAVYRSPDDEYYSTDDLCTHEKSTTQNTIFAMGVSE